MVAGSPASPHVPSRQPRARRALRDRAIAMLSAVALLAGLGLDVHATLTVHGAAHAAASNDARHAGHRGEHRPGTRAGGPDTSHPGHHADDAPDGQSAFACCHAVCQATAVPSDPGPCAEGRPGADGSPPRLESARVDGLQHAPPLRPPR